jgi:sugar O-acyltransferase (sialic acid O-acetyltransferase NeuD family)
MKRLVLFAVGSALVVDYQETCRRLGITVAAAIQNRPAPARVLPGTVLRRAEELDAELRALPYLCPLFTPANRRTASAEAAALGLALAPALLDPTAVLAASAEIGAGSYVNAACVIGGAARLGAQVVVNRGANLGHHAEIAEFASIGPGAVLAGEVKVGRGALIGAGAVILPRVRIGAHAVVGAGAVVTRDVAERHLVLGNPARIAATDRTTFE